LTDVRSFENPTIHKLLEDVIIDKVVEAKFLNRLAFINLSAIFVAGKAKKDFIPKFVDTVVSQYSLLLSLLVRELQSQKSNVEDVTACITPVTRRITPSLRLYSKWLVIHYSQVPESFWPQYIATSNTLQHLWSNGQSPPKLSNPLEEDLAAAGFAPLETPTLAVDPRKKKLKRDRARLGNRKKGFDKLLLQWGRNGGDSSVMSKKGGNQEHPTVETSLRLADLLSDAIEIATIPVKQFGLMLT
jgi:Est1 DNA/RNA binding domain